MTGDGERVAIQLAARQPAAAGGQPDLRQIMDFSIPGQPVVLLAVPDGYAHAALAALRAAFQNGCAAGADPRHDDPRWWTSECSRCGGTEWHDATCQETGSPAVLCEQCEVAVVSWRAAAAAEPGWWHQPGCPLFRTRQPHTTAAIDVLGKLTEDQFRRVGELIGRNLGRYKPWCDGPYCFGDLTVEAASLLAAYLEDIPVPYEQETATRWQP